MKLFIVPYGAFKGVNAQDGLPLSDFAAFYVTGWGGNGANANPCNGDDPAQPGEIVGYFVEFVGPNIGPVDPDATCVVGQIRPCRAVLVASRTHIEERDEKPRIAGRPKETEEPTVSNTITTKLNQSRGWTLILGIAAALLAAILLIVYLVQYRDSVKSGAVETPVLVAKNLIPKGTSGTVIAETQLYQSAASRRTTSRSVQSRIPPTSTDASRSSTSSPDSRSPPLISAPGSPTRCPRS